MRRTLITLLAVMLTAGVLAGPAMAKKKKPKPAKAYKVTANYDTPAIGHPDIATACSGANGCATIPVGPGSYFVALTINDASGLPVYATAGQDLDGDQLADNSFAICGATTDPLAVEPGYPLNIFIGIGPGVGPPACAPALGTSGSVDAIVAPTADTAK